MLSPSKADEDARRIFQDKIKQYDADNKSIVYIENIARLLGLPSLF
jgi:hypothetical protein